MLDIAWSASQERALKLLALGAAVIAAYLTYRWVERPIRRGNVGSIRGLCSAMVVPFLAGMGITIVDWHNNRANNRQHLIADQLERLQAGGRGCTAIGGVFSTATRTRRPSRRSAWSRWRVTPAAGSSSGATRMRPTSRPGYGRTDRARVRPADATSCPPILGYSAKGRPNCARVNQWVAEWVRENRPETVLLAASWPSYDGYQGVAGTIRELKALGTPRVVLVGPVISFREKVATVLARQSSDERVPERIPSTRLERLRKVDSELKALAADAGAEYVSPLNLVCDERGCLVAPGGTAAQILVFDQSHLTPVGSKYVVDGLLAQYLP